MSVRDSESVWTAVEKCAARDGSVHEWPAARVREWASARGGQIAKKFKEAKDIDGAALMRLRTVEDFKGALGMNSLIRKKLMTALRSSFARFELPRTVLNGVLRRAAVAQGAHGGELLAVGEAALEGARDRGLAAIVGGRGGRARAHHERQLVRAVRLADE